MKWLTRAKKELIDDPLGVLGIDQIQKCYAKALGEAPVTRAIKAMGYETRKSGDNNRLYSTGLSTGLASGAASGSKQIKGHTFFGQ